LEILETFKHIGFKSQYIDPSKLAEIVNEANIIVFPANRGRSRSPNIEKISSKDGRKYWWIWGRAIGDFCPFDMHPNLIIVLSSNKRNFLAAKNFVDNLLRCMT
jgi:hypothetical protein